MSSIDVFFIKIKGSLIANKTWSLATLGLECMKLLK